MGKYTSNLNKKHFAGSIAKKMLAFSLLFLLGFGFSLISPSKALATCAAPTIDYGTATQTINVSTSGTYRVWSRIMAPDTTNNSFLLEVDGGTCVTVGDSAIAANTWTWVDYQSGNSTTKNDLALAAGTHTFKLIGREAGVKVDRVILTTDTACVPTGTGDNCVVVADTTPPTVTMTAPADGSTVSGTVPLAATASDSSGISKVEFYNGYTLINTDTSYPYGYSLDTTALTDGDYTLSAKAYDNSGNSSTNSVVRVTVANQSTGTPDLVITSVDMVPASPVSGSQVLFSATVKNQGTATTPAGVKHGARFRIGGQTVAWHGNDTTTTISPGQSVVLAANNGPTGSPYWVAVEGAQTVTAEMDDLKLIAETDDTNNTLDKPFTVNAPADTQAPSVPAGVQAAAVNSSQVNISWQASTDNVGVAGYWIKRNGTAIAFVSGTTSYVDTAVQPSGTYSYAVAAIDAAGNASAYSSEVSVQTPQAADTTAPTTPTGFVAIGLSSSQINMNWTASTDNVGVAGYDVYRSTGGGTAGKIATVTTTSYGDTGLSVNTSYTYYVIARDAAGNQSLQSNSATASTFASEDTGNIYGFVKDSSGKVIRGATIRVTIDGKLYSTKSTSKGNYIITNIKAATHNFSYSANSYLTRQVEFTILSGTTIPGNVTLQKN